MKKKNDKRNEINVISVTIATISYAILGFVIAGGWRPWFFVSALMMTAWGYTLYSYEKDVVEKR